MNTGPDRVPASQALTINGRKLTVISPELVRDLIDLYSRPEVQALLDVIRKDRRWTDARVPLAHAHAESDVAGLPADLASRAVLGLDLSGTPAQVVGLQASPLPVSVPDGFLKRNSRNVGWEQTADVSTMTDLDLLRSEYDKLLGWVIDTFGVVPPGLDHTLSRLGESGLL